MNIAVVGGDKRFEVIAKKLERYVSGTVLLGHGKNERRENTNIYILPVPVSRDGITVNAPLSKENYRLEDIITAKPDIILGGLIPKDFKEKCKASNIKVYDYYNDEETVLKNAILTAEAAVTKADASTDRALYGSEVLVIGYGRIGKQIAAIMKTLKAECTCSSRSEDTLKEIKDDGLKPVNTEDILKHAEKYDYIFNTAPAPVLDEEFIKRLKSTAFVMDLATASGTDLGAAKKYNRNVGIYPALPSKCSYITAAEVIFSGIIKILSKEFNITEDNLCGT